MATSTDRWTCPTCHRTVHLDVVTTEPRAQAVLRKVQQDHARVHAREARTRALRPAGGVTGGAQ